MVFGQVGLYIAQRVQQNTSFGVGNFLQLGEFFPGAALVQGTCQHFANLWVVNFLPWSLVGGLAGKDRGQQTSCNQGMEDVGGFHAGKIRQVRIWEWVQSIS